MVMTEPATAAQARTDVVRAAFTAFTHQDRTGAERLYAPEYVFTSPQDDHLDRATFFAKCFPTAPLLGDQVVLAVEPFGTDEVFAYYEYDGSDGGRYRNTEVHRVVDGRIRATSVFFGGRVDGSRPAQPNRPEM